MAPMTKGSNLPYRQLCLELGARVTMSEMTVARRLKQKRRGEFALIRRAPDERFFGVQLAGNKPEEMAWAAALVESRGADLVDVNFGCPIDHFTRKGLGAALARQPSRIRRIVEAMKRAVQQMPVTVKIRLGWNDEDRNYLDRRAAAVDGGADAIFVHGRTRNARYRLAADWDAIGEVAAAVPVPVDRQRRPAVPPRDRRRARADRVRRRHDGAGRLDQAVAVPRGAEGDSDLDGDERVAIYRRYVALAQEHWGADEYGRTRVREFLLWHLGFWCRYAPPARRRLLARDAAARGAPRLRSPLEALLARSDAPALDYVADRLLAGERSTSGRPAPGDAGSSRDAGDGGFEG